MAYAWIDDDAHGSTDEGPLHAHHLVMAHRNLVAASEGRTHRGGWAVRFEYPERWCSVLPWMHGPFKIFLSEPCDTITVRLAYNQVEISGGGGGGSDDAIYLYATVGPPNAPAHAPPRTSTGSLTDDWTLMAEVAGPDVVELTARTHGLTGLVLVYVWTWSLLEETPEDTGTITGEVWPGGLRLSTYTPAISNPPERAVVPLIGATTVKGEVATEGVYQIGYLDDGPYGANEPVAYCIPPIDLPVTTTEPPGWSTFRLGVIEVTGVSLEAAPGDIAVAEEVFYCDQPASSNTVGGLVAEIARIARQRVPQPLIYPAQVMPISTPEVMQTIVDQGTGWTVVGAAMIGNATAESNGYHGSVTLGAIAHPEGGGRVYDRPNVEVRMRAYDVTEIPLDPATSTELSTGTTVPAELALQGFRVPGMVGGTSPLEGYTLWGANEWDQWQSRGALLPLSGDIVAGSRFVQTLEAELDETDLTYPCIVTVEIRLDREGHTLIGIWGASIANRELTR